MVHWLRKELHYFIGYEITIEESPGSHGSLRRPAALALCRFLDTASGRQKVKLLDKSVLELGAGSGLVSIVATLLGGSVTATEVPEVLVNLRCNLNQNTTGHRRHEPQVAALSWGHELEQTFPRSEYHYDYVLAADVVYNHDFLDELLVTMHHFCQSGTTLIWANEIHYPSDLGFTENFKKNFHTSLLANVDDVHIYSATAKQFGKQVFVSTEDSKFSKTLFKDYDDQIHKVKKHIDGRITADKEITPKSVQRNEDPNKHHQCALKFEELTQDTEKKNDKDDIGRKDGHYMETHKSIKNHERVHAEFKEETTDEDEGYEEETTDQLNTSWLQSRTKVKDVIGNPRRTQSINMDRKLCEEKHCFLGHEIRIIDSLEPYGPTVRPAALALCKFLESSPPQISLKSKAVLELGAGTGLVSTVASLLGAWVTATDKAAVLDILSTNISRNTRGLSKHKPQVEALSWSENLSQTFPRSTYHYDVVLAADVVYQHNLLDELLSTMRHFCQPGTILIWANKVRTQTEINFRERFKRTFSTTLLTEMEEVEIYRAKTYRQRWSY
ncbi:uncharacterized protein [Hoplias malabaricus]|uniref:uncharacterized protein n=1 Tax=Hoplias malabaricus TaxID=27720 RepID=UPI003462ECE2